MLCLHAIDERTSGIGLRKKQECVFNLVTNSDKSSISLKMPKSA